MAHFSTPAINRCLNCSKLRESTTTKMAKEKSKLQTEKDLANCERRDAAKQKTIKNKDAEPARLSACPPACLSTCLPVCMSVCLPACLLPACLPTCLPVCIGNLGWGSSWGCVWVAACRSVETFWWLDIPSPIQNESNANTLGCCFSCCLVFFSLASTSCFCCSMPQNEKLLICL
jgi:hypothetical protein